MKVGRRAGQSTSYNAELPPPTDGQEFERLCHLLFAAMFENSLITFYGKTGHKQFGIDLLGSDPDGRGLIAVQCRRIRTRLTTKEIDEAVASAADHFPDLSKLVFATTAPPDPRSIDAAKKAEKNLRDAGRNLEVAIFYWPELVNQSRLFPRVLAAFKGTDFVENRLPLYRNYLTELIAHTERIGRQNPDTEIFANYVELDIDLDAKSLPADGWSSGQLKLVDAVAAFNKVCVNVSGPIGSGKSTTCRHLVWSLLRSDAGPFPVYLQVKALSDARLHPFEAAEEELRSVHGQMASGLASNLETMVVENKPICIILDGLDEVPSRARQDFIIRLNAMAQARQCSIVVFGRSGSDVGLSREFVAAQIRPLNAAAQQAMASRLSGHAATSTLKRLISSRSVQHLTSSPLMLSWLIAAIGGRSATADNLRQGSFFRGEGGRLLRYALKLLMSDRRGAVGTSRIREELDILRRLALALRLTHQAQWSLDVLVATLQELQGDTDLLLVWGGANAFLERIAEETNILAPLDGPGRPWRFLHSAFFDLLAAEGLMALSSEDRRNLLSQIASGDLVEWRETFAMTADLLDDGEKSAFVDALEAIDPPSFQRALPYLAGNEPKQALKRLIETADWTERSLRSFASALSAKSDKIASEAAGLLTSIVSDRLSARQLAYVHHTLEWLGFPPARETFFAAAGRPIAGSNVRDLCRVLIPSGEFRPGSPVTEPGRFNDEDWGELETVPEFYLSTCAITNAEYRGFDPSKQLRGWSGVDAQEELLHPVVRVSWWEAYIFAAWAGGRLPTEREWEYACRAGHSTAFTFGNSLPPGVANYMVHPRSMSFAAAGILNGTVAAANYVPNDWGLRQMHGNVWEWCWGAYDSLSYGGTAMVFEDFAMSDWPQVARGGSWNDPAEGCRSAFRNRFPPHHRYDHLGLRVAWSVRKK